MVGLPTELQLQEPPVRVRDVLDLIPEVGNLEASQNPFHAILTGLGKSYLDICCPNIASETYRSAALRTLLTRATLFSARALVLELHIARTRGELVGDSPEERLRSFVRRQSSSAVFHTFIEKFPGLETLLDHALFTHCEGLERLSRRLRADREEISALFSIPGAADVIDITPLGDFHGRGNSVSHVRFSDGRAIMYKPRDFKSSALLRQVTELVGSEPLSGLYFPRTLERADKDGTYYWEEVVQANNFESVSQVAGYFAAMGGLAAVLYMLGASDFHFENLIASDGRLVPHDTECILKPRLDVSAIHSVEALAALRVYGDSVLATGLLPTRVWGAEQLLGIDLSPMGSEASRTSALEFDGLADHGLDTLRFVRSSAQVGSEHPTPTLQGHQLDAYQFSPQFVVAFETVYVDFVRNSAAISDAIQAPGSSISTRMVPLATQRYADILWRACHPDFLRSTSDFTAALREPLRASAKHATAHPIELVEYEVALLRYGAIPSFYVREERDSYGHCQATVHDGVGNVVDLSVGESGTDRAVRRIGEASGTDLRRQSSIVSAALTAGAWTEAYSAASGQDLGLSQMVKRGSSRLPRLRMVLSQLTDAVVRVGVRSHGDLPPAWPSVAYGPEYGRAIGSMGMDLYNGLAGLALFFQAAGTSLPSLRSACDVASEISDAISAWFDDEDRRASPQMNLGLAGLGGLLYAQSVIDPGREVDAFRSELMQASLGKLSDPTTEADVLVGASGLLGFLSGANGAPLRAEVPQLGSELARFLMSRQVDVPGGSGRSWVHAYTAGGQGFLGGFAHGSAGEAWALERHQVSGGDGAAESLAVHDAWLHQDSLFQVDSGYWADLRDFPSKGHLGHHELTAWCHGGVGIGLATLERIQFSRFSDDKDIVRLRSCIKATMGWPPGTLSLCHGEAGSLVFLSRSLAVLKEAGEEELAMSAARQLELRFERLVDQLEIGSSGLVALSTSMGPSLLTGLAGVGLALLELASLAPVIPDVLTMTCRSSDA